MGNCLVTKLKGVVDNDNLPRFDTLTVVFKSLDGSQFGFNASQWSALSTPEGTSCDIEIKGNTSAVFPNGQKSITGVQRGTGATMSGIAVNDEIKILFKKKSDLYGFRSGEGTKSILSIESLKYCENLKFVSVSEDPNFTYDVADFPDHKYDLFYIGFCPKFTGDYKHVLNFIDPGNWGQFIVGTGVHGDLALTPKGTYYLNVGSANLPDVYQTWTPGVRTGSDTFVLSCGGGMGLRFESSEDMDNFLIDNATCTISPNDTYKFIIVVSIKNISTYVPSPAAQAAISTLYSKGMTKIEICGSEMSDYR